MEWLWLLIDKVIFKKILGTCNVEGLKPCPFCAGKAAVIDSGDNVFYVVCRKCGAESLDSNGLARAVMNWNRRSDKGNEYCKVKKPEY